MRRYECNRCHEGTGLEEASLTAQCAGCHARILDGSIPAPSHDAPGLRYYLETPSLARVSQTLRASWVATFLREPVKVRSHSSEWMPRLPLGESDARDIAAYLASGGPAPDAQQVRGDPERGKQIAAAKGCFFCHEFTGASRAAAPSSAPDLTPEVLSHGIARAPDLRLARERFRPDAIVRWIENPRSVRDDAVMPALGLSPDEATDVAAYVLTTPLSPPPLSADSLERLPLLERAVSYEEVAERVFRTSCIHCHEMGGPGDTGGFGFPPRGVDVTTWPAIRRGAIDSDGTRRSLFDREPALERYGASRLVAALVVRSEEIEGRPVEGIRGMPLGLPPLSPEQLQLVESWVAQGARDARSSPRPTR